MHIVLGIISAMSIASNEKPLHWVGSAKKDLLSLPAERNQGHLHRTIRQSHLRTALLSEKVARRNPDRAT